MSRSNKSYQPIQLLGLKSTEDIPANRFVGYDGGLCKSLSKSLGVSEVSWLNGEHISVVTLGTAIIETAEALTTGQDVTSNEEGKAILASPGNPVNGRALDSCNNAGFIKILLVP